MCGLRVTENRVQRIFEPEREEVTGWRKLHNEELLKFYSSPDKIIVIKSRGVIQTGHVVCMREMSNAYKILLEGGPVVGSHDQSNELLDSIKGRKFLD
jgi:hypothetical protein